MRLPTYGGLYAWEFEKDGREVKARVEGQVVFNKINHVIHAAVSGFGLAHVPEDLARDYIAQDKLVNVMEEWCPYWEGYPIYYPSRRQTSRALTVVIDALRHRM